MAAKQGQRYRILPPKQTPRTIIGQGPLQYRYVSRVVREDGSHVVVKDIYGDVINASENVEYPHGPNIDYRHVSWIDEHPERFELIKTKKRT